jgi:hypothetical protein
MAETFFILLAGGIMLAAAVPRPSHVTLLWLRLAGIIAWCMGALGAFFYFSRDLHTTYSPTLRNVQIGLLAATVLAIIAQLGFVQVAWRRTQRIFAAAAFVLSVLAGSNLLHELMENRIPFPPKLLSMTLQALACAGVGAMVGLALMDMLLGHAYLTASKMTMAPFRRLNLALAAVVLLRFILAVVVALALQAWRPVEMLWNLHLFMIATRWAVGLLVPAVFVYMAHDCIKRRSTQAATGILYVAGVLIFIGEIIALYLVKNTGLPF